MHWGKSHVINRFTLFCPLFSKLKCIKIYLITAYIISSILLSDLESKIKIKRNIFSTFGNKPDLTLDSSASGKERSKSKGLFWLWPPADCISAAQSTPYFYSIFCKMEKRLSRDFKSKVYHHIILWMVYVKNALIWSFQQKIWLL